MTSPAHRPRPVFTDVFTDAALPMATRTETDSRPRAAWPGIATALTALMCLLLWWSGMGSGTAVGSPSDGLSEADTSGTDGIVPFADTIDTTGATGEPTGAPRSRVATSSALPSLAAGSPLGPSAPLASATPVASLLAVSPPPSAFPPPSVSPAATMASTATVMSATPVAPPAPIGPLAAVRSTGPADRFASAPPATAGHSHSGSSGSRLWNGGTGTPEARAGPYRFGWPLSSAPREVTRPFEAPPSPYAAGHRGVDLAATPGEPALAAAPGYVVFAGRIAGRGVVSIDHEGGLRTTYEPVRWSVSAGQRVARSQPIGTVEVGHSGCPVHTCLHWGVRRGADYLDPLRLVTPGSALRLKPWNGGGR